MDFKSVLIFSLALVVAELLAFLNFHYFKFEKYSQDHTVSRFILIVFIVLSLSLN